MTKTYENTWGTPLGQDCVDLCSTLPRWLGERLMFLGEYTSGAPAAYWDGDASLPVPIDRWRSDLTKHGLALSLVGNLSNLDLTIDEEERAHEAAQRAMVWVTANLTNLWD